LRTRGLKAVPRTNITAEGWLAMSSTKSEPHGSLDKWRWRWWWWWQWGGGGEREGWQERIHTKIVKTNKI